MSVARRDGSMNLKRTFDDWVFEEFLMSAEGLPLYRMLYAAAALFLFFPRFRWVSELPDSFLNPPPGPFAALRSVPPAQVMIAIELLLAVALVALLVGYRTRYASWAVSVVAIAGYGVTYSFGKIDHSILLWVAPAVLAPSGWGARWSVDRIRGRATTRTEAWPLALLALVIGIAFFTAGYAKAISGWLDLSTQAAWGYVIRNALLHGRDAPLVHLVPFQKPGVLWELFDIGTVVVEVGVIVAAVRRRLFAVALVGLTFLHLSVLLLMDINFAQAPIVYAAFLPWGVVESKISKRRGNRAICGGHAEGWARLAIWQPFAVAGLGAVLYVLMRMMGGPLVHLALHQVVPGRERLVVLALEASIAVIAVAAGVRLLWREHDPVRRL